MKKIYTLFASLIIVVCCQTNVFAQCDLAIERQILVNFFTQTTGTGWTNIPPGSVWDVTNPMSPIPNWYGIQTNANGCVTGIDLDGIPTFLEVGSWSTGNNLVGTIPDLSGLTELEYLSLGKNSLIGGIPTSLGSLTKLKHLCLGENQLGTITTVGGVPTLSTIPTALGSLHKLETLILSSNNLTGSIPMELGTSAVPNANIGCPNMKYLYLGNNQLGGTIPNELGYFPHLIVMYLTQNTLNGSIPTTFNNTNLPVMTELWLRNNKLTGGIANLATLSGLHYLEINGNPNLGVGGHTLTALESLTNIKSISVTDCGFTCSIPNMSGKNFLIACYLAKNKLTTAPGTSLSALFNGLLSLKYLGLHDNPDLNCPLTAFTDLNNLQELSLNGCAFSGTVSDLNLPGLKKIWLNKNQLTSVPNFSSSPNLEFLALSKNQLSSVPNFNLNNLQFLYLHENLLTSAPTTLPSTLKELYLHKNNIVGNIPNYTLPNIQHFWINDNLLNFGNIKAYTEWNTKITKYSPQKTKLPLTLNGSVLTADLAGEANANNLTYTWYHNGTPIGTPISGSHQYTITISGNYSYSVTNIPGVTIASNTDKNLILSSVTVTVATPLPLELLRFDAEKKGDAVVLDWRTTNEQKTSHFNIQRSTDGTYFSNIGKVTSNNKTTLNDYRFEDKNLPNGILYYRLEQVDRDEKTTFSPIRSVEKSDKFYYNLSPNPTQDVLTINGNADYDLDMTIEIYNAIGSCVYKQETAVNKGAFEEKTDMTNFAEGTYIVLLRLSNGFSLQKTVIKIK